MDVDIPEHFKVIATLSQQINDLEKKNDNQKEEINNLKKALQKKDAAISEIPRLQQTIHRKNLELDALHWVWCEGGCKSGVHRYTDLPELTKEIVDEAMRYARRLKWKFRAREFRKKMNLD